MLDIKKIREEFPILHQKIYGKDLIYFDNAATTQKPKAVIESITNLYSGYYSNVHRAFNYLSNKTTDEFETARKVIGQFINVRSDNEIIFTRGTTDSINLFANSFADKYMQENDEIIISELEHHANIVPWQLLQRKKNVKIKVLPVNDNAELEIDKLEGLISERTKLISILHVSNTLGTINPIKEVIEIAKKHGVKTLIDAAQSIQHIKIDVQELDCDFLAFSGHKIYAPTGIGVLYGKEELLKEMPVYQGGGNMIKTVSFSKTIFNDLPNKFEAGTPHIEGAIGLATAIKFLKQIGLEKINKYENQLYKYAYKKLEEKNFITIYSKAKEKISSLSFNINSISSTDVAVLLDKLGIMIRTGKHCTHPLISRFKEDGVIRISFAFYNTEAEIDCFVEQLDKIYEMLK